MIVLGLRVRLTTMNSHWDRTWMDLEGYDCRLRPSLLHLGCFCLSDRQKNQVVESLDWTHSEYIIYILIPDDKTWRGRDGKHVDCRLQAASHLQCCVYKCAIRWNKDSSTRFFRFGGSEKRLQNNWTGTRQLTQKFMDVTLLLVATQR